MSAFVPLAAGIFWRRANNVGAILSAVFGLVVWLAADMLAGNATVPPPLVGLAASVFGMVVGSLIPREHEAAPRGTHDGHPRHKP